MFSERSDYATVVGLRNTHDKSFSASVAGGGYVFVCDNLSFSGEINIARKHTRFILRDLLGLVTEAVGSLRSLYVRQEERIEAYKAKSLSDRVAHHVMIEMVRKRVIVPQYLPTVIKEWHEPTHPEFDQMPIRKNVWRLFNATTEALKGKSLAVLPNRTQRLHQLCDGVAELDKAA